MTLHFLGTGTSQGVPVIGCSCEVCRSLDYRDKRLRSSVWLDLGGQGLLIDTGPDLRQQALSLPVPRVDAVLYTHEHRDHTGGLDELRSFNFLQNSAIPVYGEARVLQNLRESFAYVFAANKYPGIPNIDPVEIGPGSFEVLGHTVVAVRALHHKLPVLGFRIGPLAYLTDVKTMAPEDMALLRGCQVLVVNALQREPHLSHLTLQEALVFAQQVGAPQTYFTHISHNLGTHAAVAAALPEGVRLAHDGLALNL